MQVLTPADTDTKHPVLEKIPFFSSNTRIFIQVVTELYLAYTKHVAILMAELIWPHKATPASPKVGQDSSTFKSGLQD